MLNRLLLFASALGLALLSGAIPAVAQVDPASLVAHDTHQGLLIAVNPYITADSYKDKFGKHTPYDGGILALEVFFKNDNDAPIRVNVDTIRLLIGAPEDSRQRLGPLEPEDVADRVLLKSPKQPSTRPTINLPGSIGKTGRDKNWNELAGELRATAMSSDILPPHATTHVFFYFDINHHYEWLSNARFDVPDLAFMLNNKALFFFQVDLAPAVH